MGPNRARSAAKAVSWRVLATLTTISLVLIFTGELDLALAVGGLETIAKLLLYYGHERIWAHMSWGRDTPDT